MAGLVLGGTSAERLRRRRDAGTPLGSTARDLRTRMASEAEYDSPLMSVTGKKLKHAKRKLPPRAQPLPPPKRGPPEKKKARATKQKPGALRKAAAPVAASSSPLAVCLPIEP